MNEKLDELTRDILEMESFDIEKNFIKTQNRVSRYTFRRMIALATGCVAAAAIVLCAILYYPKSDIEILVARAPVGQVVTVTLPDSSVVCLNSGSELTYPSKFAKDKREVTLKGQGWFKVYASRTYPFYVNTSKGMTLYVYGTEFDVAAYPEEENVEVYLATGNLNMLLSEKNVECAVKPTQKVTFDTANGTFDVENMPDGPGYDWTEGNLYFRRSSMAEIMIMLSRRFNVIIDTENTDADNNEYHASFTAEETIEDILSQLSALSDLTWHSTGIDSEGRKHITVKY
jgi:ferric-dicitrate binding protein FerR (iron transport regulator)